jgi:hypothetical protein
MISPEPCRFAGLPVKTAEVGYRLGDHANYADHPKMGRPVGPHRERGDCHDAARHDEHSGVCGGRDDRAVEAAIGQPRQQRVVGPGT